MNAIIDQQRDDDAELFAADFSPKPGDGSFVARINRSPLLREMALQFDRLAEAYRQKANDRVST